MRYFSSLKEFLLQLIKANKQNKILENTETKLKFFFAPKHAEVVVRPSEDNFSDMKLEVIHIEVTLNEKKNDYPMLIQTDDKRIKNVDIFRSVLKILDNCDDESKIKSAVSQDSPKDKMS